MTIHNLELTEDGMTRLIFDLVYPSFFDARRKGFSLKTIKEAFGLTAEQTSAMESKYVEETYH